MSNPLYDALFGRHVGSGSVFLHLPEGATLSYDDFLRRAARFASALVAVGVAPGDRVAVQVEKSPDALALYAACVQAGAIFLPLNTAYTPEEIAYFVENSGARVFVCDPRRAETLRPVAEASGAAPGNARHAAATAAWPKRPTPRPTASRP